MGTFLICAVLALIFVAVAVDSFRLPDDLTTLGGLAALSLAGCCLAIGAFAWVSG